MNRRIRLAAALVIGSLGLAIPAAHASTGPKVKKGDTVLCAYVDNPWAPAAACVDNPLPNRLPLPW